MDVGLIAGSRQMHMLDRWQTIIANNLSNAATPGFQQTLFSVSADESNVHGSRILGTEDPTRLTLPLGQSSNSFVDGSIRVTGNPHDFAIQQGGFFAVTAPDGKTFYTKDGEFQLNSEGVLVNKAGYTVDVEGGELSVDLQLGPITVTRDGSVSQDGQNLGQISAFEFTQPDNLVRLSGSYFVDPGDAGLSEMEDPVVLQGHLMGSATSAMAEMVSMIQVSRAYEMSQKIIQESDERLDRAIKHSAYKCRLTIAKGNSNELISIHLRHGHGSPAEATEYNLEQPREFQYHRIQAGKNRVSGYALSAKQGCRSDVR